MVRPLDEISLNLEASVKYRNLRTVSKHQDTGRHCHKNGTDNIEFLSYLSGCRCHHRGRDRGDKSEGRNDNGDEPPLLVGPAATIYDVINS